MTLLEYRMAAAFTMILSSKKTLAVIVIKDNMLTFISDNISDAVQVLCVLGDEKGSRSHRHDHSRRVDIAAFVIDRAGILGCSDRNVGRIFTIDVLQTIRLCYVDRVIRVIEISAISVFAGDREKVGEPGIDRRQHRCVWLADGINRRSHRRPGGYSEVVATYLFRLGQRRTTLGAGGRNLDK